MASREQKSGILPTVPTKSVRARRCVAVMFRVVDAIAVLPADIAADSEEGKALLGARVPNGWIGMVSGETPADLFWSIDEFADPYSVELMLVPTGGLCLYSPAHSLIPHQLPVGSSLDAVQAHVEEAATTGLEFTEEVGVFADIFGFADGEAEETESDLEWQHLFQAYKKGVRAGKWFTPKWPKNVYEL